MILTKKEEQAIDALIAQYSHKNLAPATEPSKVSGVLRVVLPILKAMLPVLRLINNKWAMAVSILIGIAETVDPTQAQTPQA